MPKKIFTAEQIVAKLREIEIALANGKSVYLWHDRAHRGG